ncbi:hypothetical protein AAHE18_14G108300 [Arachis hypogaea]
MITTSCTKFLAPLPGIVRVWTTDGFSTHRSLFSKSPHLPAADLRPASQPPLPLQYSSHPATHHRSLFRPTRSHAVAHQVKTKPPPTDSTWQHSTTPPPLRHHHPNPSVQPSTTAPPNLPLSLPPKSIWSPSHRFSLTPVQVRIWANPDCRQFLFRMNPQASDLRVHCSVLVLCLMI